MRGKLKTQIELQEGTIKAKKAEVLQINLLVRVYGNTVVKDGQNGKRKKKSLLMNLQ